jgi:DUF4097 and DUF4098 domain-containing protein YvlB
VCVLAAVVLASGPASAQERRSRSLEDSIERTAESLAALVERNVERWAGEIERNAERWADEIERHVERMAVVVEVEAGQSSEAARARAERQREAARERAERLREAQREREERQREAQRERAERQRENVRNWPEATERFSRTVRLGRSGVVDIENIAGDITITGGGGNDVRIEATRRMRNPSDSQARALLQNLRIEVAERAGRVEIRTIHPRARTSIGEVTYTLSVPSDADVVVKTISGDVRVNNIKGELRAETVSGDMVATSVARVQSARTVSGDVQITGAEGDVSAGSVSGDVIVRSVQARRASLETVSGDVRLSDVEIERATIGSVNGDIEYSGRLANGGRYEMNTHSGNIRVIPTGNPSFELEASTFNGDVVSEYALKLLQQSESRFGLNRAIRGSFGDGRSVLSLRSFNGDITIGRR